MWRTIDEYADTVIRPHSLGFQVMSQSVGRFIQLSVRHRASVPLQGYPISVFHNSPGEQIGQPAISSVAGIAPPAHQVILLGSRQQLNITNTLSRVYCHLPEQRQEMRCHTRYGVFVKQALCIIQG